MPERHIVADEHDIQSQRMRRDLQIQWREWLAATLQVGAQFAEPFGSDVHIRLSYATSMEAIERGLTRIEAALRRLS